MALFLLTLGGMAIVMAIMAVGVILDGRCLRGSCGGPDVTSPDGDSLACATCPRRKTEPSASRSEEASSSFERVVPRRL